MTQRRASTESIVKSVIAFLCAVTVLCTAACTPSEVDQTVSDIQAVVDEAGTVVSILQTTPMVRPREKEEDVAALKFAQAASRAAWFCASESNSKDSFFQRNEKLTDYFRSVKMPDVRDIQDPQERAAIEGLASGIDILRGRVEGNRVQMRALPRKGDGVVTAIPATITSRLLRIRTQASETITTADRLLEQAQQSSRQP